MNNFLIAFSPSITLLVITSMFGSIITFILFTKLFPSIIPSSFQFSRNNYLVGLILSLILTIVCLNMEVNHKEYVPYDLGTIDDEPTLVIPNTTQEKPKDKLPPPPEDKPIEPPIKVPIIIPVDKIEEVVADEDDIKELTETKEHYNVDSMIVATKSEAPEIVRIEEEERIHRFAEQMPRFPGCEDIEGDKEAKKKCAEQKLLEFIYKNLKYPAMAREINIEGTVTAQFVVDKEGSVVDIKILRGLGGGLSEAALKAIGKMNAMDEKWTPGKQGGQAVKVLFTLPIRFKLE